MNVANNMQIKEIVIPEGQMVLAKKLFELSNRSF